MRKVELLNGVAWHFECMVLAAGEIEKFRPPADLFQMRMHYSLYLTNLMSAIDMVKDMYGVSFEDELKDSLKTSNFSGDDILGYMRELRNGVVHRGVDPTSGGVVVDGVICAVAPPRIKKRNSHQNYAAPAPLLRDIFIHCEIGAKSVIARFLEPSFKELSEIKPDQMLVEILGVIENVAHMPDRVKEAAYSQFKCLEPEMMVRAKMEQAEKFRSLLKPHTGHRIT